MTEGETGGHDGGGRDGWVALGMLLALHSHSRATHFGEEDGFPIKDVGNDKRGRLPGMTEGETAGMTEGGNRRA